MRWASGFALIWLAVAGPIAAAAAPESPHAPHVAAYDAAPYAARDPSGVFWGASVDLWRRVAEDQHWAYDLTPVGAMEDVLDGDATARRSRCAPDCSRRR